MKKLISLLLCIVLCALLCACARQGEVSSVQKAKQTLNYAEDLKGIWFSYYEIEENFSSLSRTQAQQKAEEIFADLAEKGFNTVFFHVRAFADAMYRSTYFPVSAYCNKEYDLLRIALNAAHMHEISLHAWINPYRVAIDKELSELPQSSPAVELYEKSKQNLIFYKGSIYMNPARKGVQKLILNGIREIVENYDVDGIHFDDYFYPTTDKSIDKQSYAGYKNSGGQLSREDYRRESVTALIDASAALIKSVNETILFGVSPQCSVERNKNELFADVMTWVEHGSVDYLMPQIYFGFENESSPFEKCVTDWTMRMKGKSAHLYCGLALYKSGKEDTYASDDTESEESAYYEWVNHTDIIARQLQCLKAKGVRGYTIFSYSSLRNRENNPYLAEEIENFQAVAS